MYTKTQWVDNTTPIDKNNLNKIEQGIYDNSLVVDAITNTLNPTDTVTYKTAELTEGQITDVIGVSDIIIKGQTSQDGTPTPSAPVDVNVVSGSNVLDISNSNTNFAKEPSLIGYNVNSDGLGVSSGYAVSQKIFVNNETKFYYGLNTAFSNVSDSILRIGFFDENDNFLSRVLGANIATSPIRNVTIPNNTKYIMIGASNNASNGFWREIEKVYYGFSSTIVPHQGKELPLDLPVENLFDKDDTSKILNAFINASDKKITTSNGTKSLYVPIKPNTEYVISKILSARFIVGTFENYEIGTISSQPINVYNTSTSGTITSGANDRYLCVFYYLSSADTLTEEEIRNSIQVEEGSKANAYTPYGTESIELCKIGDYQDYFYRDNSKGKWYLHKEIGKTIFNGSETWTYSVGNLVFYTDALTLSRTNSNLFCNRFSKVANTTTYANMNTGEIKYDGLGSRRIIIKYTDVTSVADFKTWLASNNTTVYYPLATETNTEIADTTLISQLEAIYNAPLYEETNITQTNNDLPMVLDITACKDNINGIKAFIRK